MLGLHSTTDSPRLTSEPVRVALVEDDADSRIALIDAVAAAPDMQLSWAATSRAEALARLPSTALDVLLVDLGLPDGSGLDVIAQARCAQPALR